MARTIFFSFDVISVFFCPVARILVLKNTWNDRILYNNQLFFSVVYAHDFKNGNTNITVFSIIIEDS